MPITDAKRSLWERASVGIVFLLVVLAAASPFASWLRYGSLIKAKDIGNQLGLSALILAIGGFGVTLWQIQRARSATVAATKAVDSLRFRLQAFEDQQLCRDGLSLCSEIERLHDFIWQTNPARQPKSLYVVLPERYRTLNLTLIKLRVRLDEEFDADQQTRIQSSIAKLSDSAKSLTRKLQNPARAFPNLEPLQSSLHMLAEMLTALSVNLDQRAVGDHDEQ